jgi:hypothetical protein
MVSGLVAEEAVQGPGTGRAVVGRKAARAQATAGLAAGADQATVACV